MHTYLSGSYSLVHPPPVLSAPPPPLFPPRRCALQARQEAQIHLVSVLGATKKSVAHVRRELVAVGREAARALPTFSSSSSSSSSAAAAHLPPPTDPLDLAARALFSRIHLHAAARATEQKASAAELSGLRAEFAASSSEAASRLALLERDRAAAASERDQRAREAADAGARADRLGAELADVRSRLEASAAAAARYRGEAEAGAAAGAALGRELATLRTTAAGQAARLQALETEAQEVRGRAEAAERREMVLAGLATSLGLEDGEGGAGKRHCQTPAKIFGGRVLSAVPLMPHPSLLPAVVAVDGVEVGVEVSGACAGAGATPPPLLLLPRGPSHSPLDPTAGERALVAWAGRAARVESALERGNAARRRLVGKRGRGGDGRE